MDQFDTRYHDQLADGWFVDARAAWAAIVDEAEIRGRAQRERRHRYQLATAFFVVVIVLLVLVGSTPG